MELKQLKYFARIAELGGFSKAAVSLSISQPALSKTLRQLEQELGKELLLRNGRGVTLTDEGSVFLERARFILDQAERAKQEIEDLTTAPTGKVVLGCASTVGPAVVAKVFAAFRARFPQASLEIIELKGWTVYEWLRHGRIDIGLLYDAHSSASIRTMPLRKTDLCLVSSVAHSDLEREGELSFRDLHRYPLILPGNPRAIRLELERAADETDSRINVSFKVESVANILELVRRGYGFTVLPRDVFVGNPLALEFQVNALIEPRIVLQLALAVPAKRRLSRLCNEAIVAIGELDFGAEDTVLTLS